MPGKPGRGQANALDKLDSVTRDKCINLLLENKRGAISQVSRLANVSRQAVWEYKSRHLVRALELASRIAKAETGEFQSAAQQLARTAQVTRDVAGSLPILAARDKRLEALQNRHDRMMIVMNERAEDLATVPGGKSGLLVRQIKQIGNGESAREVEEFKLDTGLLSEFREHEKQMAIELGQWDDRGTPSSVSLISIVMSPKCEETPEPAAIEVHAELVTAADEPAE